MASKGYCYLCKKFGYLDEHHIYGGAYRNKSTKYGMIIHICRNCHNEIHFGKNSRELMNKLRAEFQIKFNKKYPELDFVKIFGRNYITEAVKEEKGIDIKDMDL